MRRQPTPMPSHGSSSPGQKRPLRLGCLCLGVAIVSSLIASSVASEDSHGRTLGGYRFVPSNLVADPFVTTHFRNATGFGIALDVKLPVLVIETDTLLALDGNVAFAQLEFEYQHAASDRVAFRFKGSGSSRLGTSAQSLLTQGVSALTGFEAGTTIRAWQNDRVLVSGVADIGFGNTFRIDFARFVDDVINGDWLRASIVTKDDGVLLSTGLRAAWALAPWVGLHGQFEGGYRNLTFEDDLVGLAGVAGGVDLGQRINVPVGFLGSLSYDNVTITGANVGARLVTGLEIIYTGREDFALGLQISYSRTPLNDPDITLHGSVYNLTARYYF